VVNDAGSEIVVLNVYKDNVPVPRSMLVVAEERPAMWTVVKWEESQRGAHRASEAGLGMMYAVCPSCGTRSQLDPPDADTLTCQECHTTAPVGWESFG
jgi:hypothetical protein